MDVWVEREIAGCQFPDQRLKTRFDKLLGQLSEKIGAALPAACQDWAATKAAYRFFSNPRVDESIILAGHFAATAARMSAARGPILVLHDTTEFSFQRERPEAIGKTRILPSARIGEQPITKCGLLMHSSLAVTTDGKPLGLTAVKFWTRKKFKGTNALKGGDGGKHSVNTTRIPIEEKESVRWLENLKQSTRLVNPNRCVHIGDRESDIYELFALAADERTHFLVRTCVDRVAGMGNTTIAKDAAGADPGHAFDRIAGCEASTNPGRVTTAVQPDDGASADWQAQNLSTADADRDPCLGTWKARRP